MTQAKAIVCKLECEHGRPSPQAVAYVTDWHITNSSRGTVENIGEEYKVSDEYDGIAYTVMYYHDQSTRQKGKKAALLRIDDGEGGFTSAIPVDLNKPEIANILNSSLSRDDKVTRAIEEDLKRKY